MIEKHGENEEFRILLIQGIGVLEYFSIPMIFFRTHGRHFFGLCRYDVIRTTKIQTFKNFKRCSCVLFFYSCPLSR
jgi:hypothetical protein